MWDRIRKFVKDSETIAWSYIQMAIGVLALVVTYVDPSLVAPVLPVKWLPWFLLANGIFTKYLRERRTEPPEPKEPVRGIGA